MPDTKITALTALTAADPANDVLPIVDVSDTTMAASGTTKKISINNVLGCSGTATLASATISGAASAASLTVTGATIPTNGLYLPTTNTLEFAANSLAQYRIAPLGVFSWYDGAGGTRMTLNSTGLGVGVTPAAGRGAVQLSAGIGFPATQVASSDANTLDDYEEGTWTPAIEGTTTAGSGTYSNQVGRYTKIGNQVTILARLSWSAHTGTGNMVISGFPFTIANVNNLIPSGAIGYTANIAINAGNLLMIGGDPNSSKAFFWQTPTGGGSTSTVPLDTAGDVAFSMTYFV